MDHRDATDKAQRVLRGEEASVPEPARFPRRLSIDFGDRYDSEAKLLCPPITWNKEPLPPDDPIFTRGVFFVVANDPTPSADDSPEPDLSFNPLHHEYLTRLRRGIPTAVPPDEQTPADEPDSPTSETI